ncbi:MAG TPA: bL21 family ribosomal protein [Gaiellaceae bacterium]|jgi:large subunit ribosomal protein L21|nr:bL21 family ribosomal protein [Gaiellaceae bacterium]
MDYAIIKLGNKQHRVRDGETLVVDRLPAEEGKSFEPVVLLGDLPVTATVLSHERGPKILIGKYRRRTGYKRHNGFRAATSRVEITLGTGGAKKAAAKAAPPKEAQVAETVAASPIETTPAEKTKGPEHSKAEQHPKVEAPLAKAPEGYEGMTIAQVTAAAKDWSVPELEAALTHEVETSARKGAIAALEAALKKAEEPDGA